MVEQNEDEVKECVEEEVMDVDMDVMSMLKCFDMFYDCIAILLLTRKHHLIPWIKQKLNAIIVPNCDQGAFVVLYGARQIIIVHCLKISQ